MKLLVDISRWVVGILFLFSGLIKANDPLGLSYKMEEFFERWAADGWMPGMMNWLHQFSLGFSVLMISLEIIAGVAILIGIRKNFFVWLLLALILFFTGLTAYAAFSGKIAECGCFGNCLPLTSMQSFLKDVVLLVLISVLVVGKRYIRPAFSKPLNIFLLALAVVFSLAFQWYTMRYLPVVDCLPFKTGNNILELRKMPADAVPDKKDYIFIYEKEGREKEFTIKDLPDSSWNFVSRRDVIIEKGFNNEPPIKDYVLTSAEGEDSTEILLTLNKEYFMFYVKQISKTHRAWEDDFKKVYDYAAANDMPLVVVTPDPQNARRFFNEQNNYPVSVLALDAVAFKTAARTNPELYLMHGPVVIQKWGKATFTKAIKK